MKIPPIIDYPPLTDEEVRTQYFIVAQSIVEIVLHPSLAASAKYRRELVEASGGRFDVIGWKDGITVFLARLNAADPLDLDFLVRLYRCAREARDFHEEHDRFPWESM